MRASISTKEKAPHIDARKSDDVGGHTTGTNAHYIYFTTIVGFCQTKGAV